MNIVNNNVLTLYGLCCNDLSVQTYRNIYMLDENQPSSRNRRPYAHLITS